MTNDDGDEPETAPEVSPSCPLPETHDRFNEAHYFLHRMEAEYHDPGPFRYNANAFLSALKSVVEMLRKETERRGQIAWMKERKKVLRSDPVLSSFHRGRDIVLHQRTLFAGSRIEIGLFRG